MAGSKPVGGDSKRSRTRALKSRLIGLWFVWSGLLFVIFVGASLADYFGSKTQEAWAWFVPLLCPTLSVIVGALVADSKGNKEGIFGGGLLLVTSFWLSVVYLTSITVTLLVSPIVWSRSGITPIDLFKMSQSWLQPVQALVAGSFGAVLVGKKTEG